MQLHDFAEADGSTQASLARASVGMFDGNTVSHTVETTTIDTYMAQAEIDAIDLLKIDTEGFDINVLRGAKDALRRGAIKAIQFEFIPADIAMRVTMRDFFEVLQGYRLFRLCLNGGVMPLPRYDVKRCEVYVTHYIVRAARPVISAGLMPSRARRPGGLLPAGAAQAGLWVRRRGVEQRVHGGHRLRRQTMDGLGDAIGDVRSARA